MELRTNTLNDWKILAPCEKRIDAYMSQSFKDSLIEAAGDGNRRIIIDLSSVEAIDSSALGSLVFLKQYMGEEAEIVIASPQSGVTNILKLTHLDEVFQIVETPQDVVGVT